MSSASMTSLTRNHHATKRFNNGARLKIANHHPMTISTVTQSTDVNNNSNNSGAVLAHYEHAHPDSLLEALNDLRLSRQLCDVTIVVGQHEYPCHKVRTSSVFHMTLIDRSFVFFAECSCCCQSVFSSNVYDLRNV